MLKFYKVTTIVFIQVLFALTTAGIIIAVCKDALAIALACAAAQSCLHAIWRSETLLVFFAGIDGKEGET